MCDLDWFSEIQSHNYVSGDNKLTLRVGVGDCITTVVVHTLVVINKLTLRGGVGTV